MGNIASRYKSAPQSINELLEMPNLKRASDLPEADMTDSPERRNAKSNRFAVDKKSRTVSSGKRLDALPAFTSKRKTAGIRIHPELEEALQKNGQRLSDLANRLLMEHAHSNGWL